MEKVCAICGKPSGKYPLCPSCFQLRDAKKIEKCEKCGEWHYTGKLCKCQLVFAKKYTELPSEGFEKCIACGAKTTGYAFCKNCWNRYTTDEMLELLNNPATPQNKENNKKQEGSAKASETEPSNTVVIIDENNKSKCITCGKKTDGLLFCGSCYHKYKDKNLLFRITRCNSVELLDADYEGKYICADGHIVKSKSERDIDNYLFEKCIQHAYEKDWSYGKTAKEILKPDFCLPNYLGKGKDVYIEHWGYEENNIQYTKTKKFKMPIYKNSGITLVCTYEKTDTGKIDSVLDRKLKKENIDEGKINFEE